MYPEIKTSVFSSPASIILNKKVEKKFLFLRYNPVNFFGYYYSKRQNNLLSSLGAPAKAECFEYKNKMIGFTDVQKLSVNLR